jgi:hypothetical protein
MPDTHGTMDVSLEWPLSPLYGGDELDGTGALPVEKTIVAKKPGMHSLITKLMVTARGAGPAAGDFLQLTLKTGNGINQMVIGQTFLIVGKTSSYPVISCIVSDTATTKGMKPVYIPEGGELTFSYTANVASVVTYQWEFFQLPSTQPMTTLLNY